MTQSDPELLRLRDSIDNIDAALVHHYFDTKEQLMSFTLQRLADLLAETSLHG